jgi:signal transduction histidine kinase
MDTIFIVANSETIVNDVVDSFKIIADVYFESSTQPSYAFDQIRDKKPQLLFLGDDLSMEDMSELQKQVKNDSLIKHIPLIFVCRDWDAHKMDWMLKGKLIDDWLSLNKTISERLFKLEQHLTISHLRQEMHKLRMDYDYVSSELVYFVRNEEKEKRKLDKDQLLVLIDIMHYLRTYLTGIKGGASILASSESNEEQKMEALQLIQKNAKKMDDYLNEQDLTVSNENKKKPLIKIIKLKQILEAIVPKISLSAQKKNIHLKFEKSDQNSSVLLHHAGIMPAIRSALESFVNASFPGSSVEIGLEPLFSANLVRVYAKNLSNRVDRVLFQHLLDEGYEWLNALNDAESKFELYSDSLFTGIQFYLPRLD